MYTEIFKKSLERISERFRGFYSPFPTPSFPPAPSSPPGKEGAGEVQKEVLKETAELHTYTCQKLKTKFS